jgi:DNA-binding Lrp family transcriptional regulator
MPKQTTHQTGDQALVRQINLSLIMHALWTDSPTSRANLSQRTKLNKTTVSNLISELIERGFVREIGTQTSGTGRPAIQLILNPAAGYIVSCEIGVGYGGLCRIIDSYFRSVTSYCLVDLQPVLGLTQKYLNHFSINTSISCKTAENLSVEDRYDLVISNYAFTELRREVQDIYLEKIILNSQKGYITYNQINFLDFNGYSVDELMEIIPNGKILHEIEMTNPGDCILVWSQN